MLGCAARRCGCAASAINARCAVRAASPLTETIAKLKQLAIQQQIKQWRESTHFYLAFGDVMRRYGRMRETEFMARYFLSTNPFDALGYATMGLTLPRRGKLKPELPMLRGEGKLAKLFDRAAELEKRR